MEAVLDTVLTDCPQATFTIENLLCSPSVSGWNSGAISFRDGNMTSLEEKR